MADQMADREKGLMVRDKGSGSVFFDRGRNRWKATIEAGYTPRGTRRRVTVIGKTKRDALAKLKQRQRELAIHGAPAGAVRTSTTVKAWADQWLKEAATRLRPATYNATRSQIQRWVVPAIGHIRLDRLSPAHVRSVPTAMVDADLAVASANRAHRELVHMLKDAREEGHAVPDRVLSVRGPGPGRSNRTAIPEQDLHLLLDAALTRPDSARWLLALIQGLRPAEALGLTWASVDLDVNMITVQWQLQALPYKVRYDRDSGFRIPLGYEAHALKGRLHLVRPKTGSGWREVPVGPWVAEKLKSWRALAPPSRFDLVFPVENGGPRDGDEDRAEFRRLLHEAGLDHADGDPTRLYALYEARHTAATMLHDDSDDTTLTSIMGHTSILSTKPYLHTSTVVPHRVV